MFGINGLTAVVARLRAVAPHMFGGLMLVASLAFAAGPAAAQSPNFTSYSANPSTTGGIGSRIVFTIGFNTGNRVATSFTVTSALPGVTYTCSPYVEELNQQITCSGTYYTTASDVANGRAIERPVARLISFSSTTNRTGSTITATVLPVIPAPVASGFTASAVAYNTGSASATTINLGSHATYDPTSYAVSASANGGSVSVDSAGLVTYIPPVGFRGNDTFTFNATNAGGTSSNATVTVPVNNPTLSATLTGSGQQAVALSGVAIVPAGGRAPHSCATSVSSGALPAGVSINSNCSLSGTPAVSGTFNFSVAVTDSSTGTGPFTQVSGPFALVIAPAVPVVTSIAPAAGPISGGTAVTVTGSHFQPGATSVTIGGVAILASGVTVSSGTTLTFVTPAHASGSVDVTVTTAGGTSNAVASGYTYVAAPTVSSITPTAGPNSGGTSVTIVGANLSGATAVTFGATAASGFSVISSTVIVATAPAGTGTVDVRVTTSGGTSATSAADQYTYVPAPTVTSVSPTAGPASGGTVVTITGMNFTGVTAVTFGGTAATGFTVNSATSITATAPAGVGMVDIQVTTAGGVSATSSADQYTYIAAPAVTSIAPSAGPNAGGTSVTITGVNFLRASAVTFGGTAAASFAVNSATSITAVAPAGTGTVDIRVTAPGGTSATSAADQYTYVAAPTLASVSPSSGPSAGGTSVTLTGANLSSATSVTFGGTSAGAFTVVSATQITVTAPPHADGPVNIVVTTVGGSATLVSSYTYFTLAVNETPLANGQVAAAYNGVITSTGGSGPLTYGLTVGALPTGLSLSPSGAITGTPTTSGTFNFTVQVSDGTNTDTGAFSITIAAPAPPTADPEVVVVPAPDADQPTSIDLSGSVGNATAIQIVTPPAVGAVVVNGLSVTYTPQAGYFGVVTFTYRAIGASDGGGQPATSAPATVTITYSAPTLAMNPAAGALPTAQVAAAYSQTFTANGGTDPYSYAVTTGALPAGLTLSAGGVLSGTPTAGGTFNFTVTATDSSTGTGPFSIAQAYSLTVNAATIVVNPATLPNGSRGAAYSQTVAASGGIGPYTYSVSAGALPTGLGLAPTTGVVSGTPTATGTFSFTITATDSSSGSGPFTGSRAYTVTIAALSVTVTPTTLPNGMAGSAYSQQFSSSGGQGTYTYARTVGALPTGMTLSTTGLFSGTPTAGGTFSFTITSTDSFGNTGSVALTLNVTARPDPSLDPDVRGLSTAQAEATRRFADAQIDNFTRRLEQLHSGGAAAGNDMGLRLDGSAFTPLDLSQQASGNLNRLVGQGMFSDRERLGREEAVSMLDARRATEVEAAAQPLPGSTPADGSDGSPGAVRVWTGGSISLGDREATSQTAELSIQSSGVSLGADMSVSDDLDIGFGVGLGRENTDVGVDDSTMDAENWVGVAYASWRPSPNTFIDGIAGYGGLDFDMRRRTPGDTLVFGQREGSVWFGSVSTGFDRQIGSARWLGYGRLELMTAELDAFTETGDPFWALSFDDRSINSRQAALGVRYERDMTQPGMVWTPGLRVEWSHEFGDAGGQSIQYADFLVGPVYTIEQDGWDRSQLTVGGTLRMRSTNGWTVSSEVDGRFGGSETMTSLRLLVARRF